MVGACSSPGTESSSTVGGQSRVIGEWRGKGPLNTEPFTIDSGPWTIEWQHVPARLKDSSIGSLQIIVWDVEKPNTPAVIAATSAEEESGTQRMEETGAFYLMINATNTIWGVKVVVEEQKE